MHATSAADIIRGLRAVRHYRQTPLSSDAIDAIVEAGRWTGSSTNKQPWTIVAITDRDMLEAVAAAGKYAAHLAGSPLGIVIVRHPEGGDFDMGRLAQNMMLAAAAEGVGSCPVTLHDEERARRVLGVPSDHGCRWAVSFGYPDRTAAARTRRSWIPRGRKPRHEFLRWQSFS